MQQVITEQKLVLLNETMIRIGDGLLGLLGLAGLVPKKRQVEVQQFQDTRDDQTTNRT